MENLVSNRNLLVAILVLLTLNFVHGVMLQTNDLLIIEAIKNEEEKVNANLQNTLVSTAITLDMSNWKTYRNEEYGFEFKYPGDWVIASNDFLQEGLTLNNFINNPKTALEQEKNIMTWNLFISDANAGPDFIEENVKFKSGETIDIGGVKAYLKTDLDSMNNNFSSSVSFISGKSLFSIVFISLNKDAKISKALNIQILSTFRFVQ